MLIDSEDLERVILGIVWKRGPCTPYAVRKELSTSPSSHFSGSPGSVYPILRRLESQGCLGSEESLRGQQKRRLYFVEEAGLAALKEWLSPPLPDSAVGLLYDPLRTRLYFLSVLPPGVQRAFLQHTRQKLLDQLVATRQDAERYRVSGDDFSRLAAAGGVMELESRIRWTELVARALIEESLGEEKQ